MQKKKPMSFKTYLKNIEEKTGKTPHDFQTLAEEKGFTKDGAVPEDIKATAITDWLKSEFELGHGHAMAVYAFLKGKRE
jgi:hypothetical protein